VGFTPASLHSRAWCGRLKKSLLKQDTSKLFATCDIHLIVKSMARKERIVNYINSNQKLKSNITKFINKIL